MTLRKTLEGDFKKMELTWRTAEKKNGCIILNATKEEDQQTRKHTKNFNREKKRQIVRERERERDKRIEIFLKQNSERKFDDVSEKLKI